MAKYFSNFVRQQMGAVGWDNEALAEKTGIHRVTVSRHLNGRSLPHYSTRRLYAQAFGLHPDDFERGWRGSALQDRRPDLVEKFTDIVSGESDAIARVPGHADRDSRIDDVITAFAEKIIELAREKYNEGASIDEVVQSAGDEVRILFNIEPVDEDNRAMSQLAAKRIITEAAQNASRKMRELTPRQRAKVDKFLEEQGQPSTNKQAALNEHERSDLPRTDAGDPNEMPPVTKRKR